MDPGVLESQRRWMVSVKEAELSRQMMSVTELADQEAVDGI